MLFVDFQTWLSRAYDANGNAVGSGTNTGSNGYVYDFGNHLFPGIYRDLMTNTDISHAAESVALL